MMDSKIIRMSFPYIRQQAPLTKLIPPTNAAIEAAHISRLRSFRHRYRHSRHSKPTPRWLGYPQRVRTHRTGLVAKVAVEDSNPMLLSNRWTTLVINLSTPCSLIIRSSSLSHSSFMIVVTVVIEEERQVTKTTEASRGTRHQVKNGLKRAEERIQWSRMKCWSSSAIKCSCNSSLSITTAFYHRKANLTTPQIISSKVQISKKASPTISVRPQNCHVLRHSRRIRDSMTLWIKLITSSSTARRTTANTASRRCTVRPLLYLTNQAIACRIVAAWTWVDLVEQVMAMKRAVYWSIRQLLLAFQKLTVLRASILIHLLTKSCSQIIRKKIDTRRVIELVINNQHLLTLVKKRSALLHRFNSSSSINRVETIRSWTIVSSNWVFRTVTCSVSIVIRSSWCPLMASCPSTKATIALLRARTFPCSNRPRS